MFIEIISSQIWHSFCQTVHTVNDLALAGEGADFKDDVWVESDSARSY